LSTDPKSDRYELLERAEEVAQAGSWILDVETDRMTWSENLYRIFGLEPGEITPSPDYVLARIHVDDRDRVERALDGASLGSPIGPLEYRIVSAEGAVRHLRAVQQVIGPTGEQPRKLVGSVRDVTDWWRSERQIAALVAVSESLGHWGTFEQGAADLLRNLAQALECSAGVLWVPGDDVLVPRAVWQSRTMESPEFEAEIAVRRLRPGVGFPGTVWQTKEPRVRSRARGERTTALDVDSLVAIPALHNYEVIAVLEFFSPSTRTDLSERLIRSLKGIGHELGEFLSHRRGDLSPHKLTPRELEVLQLASYGRTAREIADQLFVSPSTVATHFKHIYEKYGVSDRASAVAKAVREGLIE
jgi:DNA-binding CsgD family transcriptional regulator